tara:strand:+ start:167 stop:436 length:270 start_codon:yes stop_codon:yes gene_type:complete
MADFKIFKLTGTTSHTTSQTTGSIAKLLALGADDAEQTCLRIEFGSFSEPESLFTPTSVITDVTVPAGTYIEGPIGRVSGSNFLVYVNN